tara:strand:+ start:3575 stop:4849 length:1275 start_codon:yes stop_codon:yes gene_type:complete
MENNYIINFLKKNSFPLNRSLGGKNNIKTLLIIKKFLKTLNLKKIKSGKKIFDWNVPLTWELKEGYIKDANDKKIISSKENFLHVLNYSQKINKILTKKELMKNLYFLKKQPNAIPYVTSYYKKKWGFCVKYKQIKKFKTKNYKVIINSTFTKKGLDYGEVYFKGKSKKEILFSTYICHPNLGNDNFSGIIVNTLIANYVKKLNRNYSYRFIFIPETVGSIFYINKNLKRLKMNLLAGYVITCLGKGSKFNILSKYEENLSFNLLKNYLKSEKIKYSKKDWQFRGSDERQFSSPNVDLPFSLITRNKFSDYKEYHTSLDNINFVKNSKMLKTFKFFKGFIDFIENEKVYLSNFKCEPFLSKKNLYSDLTSSFKKEKDQDLLVNILDYCDGRNSSRDIIRKLKINNKDFNRVKNLLLKNKLIKQI